MLSAAELGVDDRAASLLQGLEEDKRQAVLQKLQEGIIAGKVRNASAYVVGSVYSANALGVDEDATRLLQTLAKPQQKLVLEKLRQAQDVRNPSAWVAKAVLSASGGPKSMNSHVETLDPSAKSLLQSLPAAKQEEIISVLMSRSGVRNPSAWVARSALAAGAVPGASPGALHGSAPTVSQHVASNMCNDLTLDAGAMSLLQTLTDDAQQHILGMLQSQSGIRNPSAWVAKAAIAAGASPQSVPQQSIVLDARAMTLMDTLPQATQQDILSKLQDAGHVRNPSAWVARAALKAGAITTSSTFAPARDAKGEARITPY